MTLPGNRKLVCVGSYRLTGRRLGKGNFAKVEEALHTVLKAKVALKIINISEIKEEYVIRNLHREARLMSQLNHPCIASLFETMQNGNVYYLVTELVGGGDLCNFIKSQRGGKLEERTTKIFGRQLVSAVAYMHSMGIVHRDLKMENIMLNDSRTQLKIVDFGLSNSYTADAPLRTHCGSPEYAAPELFVTGQLYGPQVDLWSLGVILYGMVLGHLPFLTSRDTKISSHDRRNHLLQQINRGLAPAHRKSLSVFSLEFRALLARLLMPDPTKRIRVIELVRHPWLTDRNRKPLRTTGNDNLDNPVKNFLLREVGKLLHADPAHIINAIRSEPFGVIGGMYNILTFKKSQQNEQTSKETLVTPFHQQPIRPATTSCTAAAGPYHVTKFQTVDRPVTAFPCAKHATSPVQQPQIVQKPDSKKHSECNNEIPGSSSRLRVIGTRNINKSYSLRSGNKPSTQNGAVVKPSPEAIASRRTKSEPIPQQMKTGTATSTQKSTERATKRKSEQLQQQQQQQPRHSSARKSAPTSSSRSRSRTTRPASSAHENKHIRDHGHGQQGHGQQQSSHVGSRPRAPQGSEACAENQLGKRLLNEPIARCIAGYVGKYMNGNGDKFRWIKEFASFHHPGTIILAETN